MKQSMKEWQKRCEGQRMHDPLGLKQLEKHDSLTRHSAPMQAVPWLEKQGELPGETWHISDNKS